ncbi:MAG: RNA polymerase sigma factor [Thermoleophilaceae bacterium]
MRSEEFERLYAEHAEPLFAFLVYRTGNQILAEDIVADTFEKVIRARRRFDPRKGSEKTWLYTIALNSLRDHARRQSAETRAYERVATPGASVGDGLDSIERRDEITRALAILSDDEREAIALRYGADLTAPQIAKATGERLSTVEGRIYRALGKLRDNLA